MASLGIITGALFLMPAVTAFVGSFFVDEVAEAVEREHYPAEPPGRALPFFRALIEGVKFAALALVVYLCALPFIFFAGLGVIILFLANSYLLGREYFELAAMRFRPPARGQGHAQEQCRLCFPRRNDRSRCSCRFPSSIWRRRFSPWPSWCTSTRSCRAPPRTDRAAALIVSFSSGRSITRLALPRERSTVPGLTVRTVAVTPINSLMW